MKKLTLLATLAIAAFASPVATIYAVPTCQVIGFQSNPCQPVIAPEPGSFFLLSLGLAVLTTFAILGRKKLGQANNS